MATRTYLPHTRGQTSPCRHPCRRCRAKSIVEQSPSKATERVLKVRGGGFKKKNVKTHLLVPADAIQPILRCCAMSSGASGEKKEAHVKKCRREHFFIYLFFNRAGRDGTKKGATEFLLSGCVGIVWDPGAFWSVHSSKWSPGIEVQKRNAPFNY